MAYFYIFFYFNTIPAKFALSHITGFFLKMWYHNKISCRHYNYLQEIPCFL